MSKIDSEIDQISETLEKAAKMGEGSRGGKVIGHTKSGKPVYEDVGHSAHAAFTPEEHEDAGKAHTDLSDKHWDAKGHAAKDQMHGGSKKARKQADESYEHHSKEDKINREAGAYHRRMADHKAGRMVGDLTPEDHRQRAEDHKTAITRMTNPNPDKKRSDPIVNGITARGEPIYAEKKEKKPMKKSIDTLLETVKAMGPEALKKAIPTLSEEQRALLAEVLEKGKKPVSMDAEQPKEQMLVELAQEKKKNSKPRAGEADEDMVKEEADSIQHQGDHSPEGLEGQVIKAMPQEEVPAPQPVEPKMEMKDAKPSELADRMKARGMKKEDAMAKLRERGHHDMAEEMDKCWDMKKALADLEPAELDEHKTALKVKADAEHKASEIKAVAHAEEKAASPKIQKSVVWGEGTERLLKASTRRGQNSHYTVESTILEEDASTKEVLKKGGYLNEGEPMAKSTTQKIDINDMIENKQDYAQDQIERIQGLAKAAKSGPFTVASFDQETFAKALPMGAEPMGSPMPGASDESQHIGRTDSGKPVSKDSYMRSEDFQDEDHKDAAKLHKSRADDMHAMMRDSSKMEHEKADLEPKRDFHDLSAEYHDCKACGKHDLAKCYRDQLDKCWMK